MYVAHILPHLHLHPHGLELAYVLLCVGVIAYAVSRLFR